ncbi:hypothetical protein HU200_059843 [Digitaria exilis]|uniref:Uncharacterized protein n=1 Tax=Digitaria exilis TaxID=1010633 RepID=A0A835AA80_9POAL|nr:hypothetical protein HU200_059843 [Digitaria exilis]
MKRAPALCLLTTLLAFYLLVPSSAVPLASELQIFDFACFDSFFCAFSVVGRDQTIRFCGLQDCKRCPCKRLNRCHRLAALQSRRYHNSTLGCFILVILSRRRDHFLMRRLFQMKMEGIVPEDDGSSNSESQRMAFETQDYGPPTPNNHHKPPGWR